ncbi:hypothetical protein R5P99_08255 [Oenococcus oeni]|nr:hypothetical protein [Oenococcus oeni]
MKININDQNSYGQINPNLHGQFIEFLGNCIDEGIWVGKDSKIPNIDGMRKGTVDALKNLLHQLYVGLVDVMPTPIIGETVLVHRKIDRFPSMKILEPIKEIDIRLARMNLWNSVN